MDKFSNYIKEQIIKKKRARGNLEDYIRLIKNDYEPEWFHKVICEEFTDFSFSEKSEYKMLFMPPQNGKSLHSTIGLPTFLLGLNPKLKIAVVSYNAVISSDFGDEISRILKTDIYKSIFPKTIVGEKGYKDNKYITETTEGGYIISVGVGGTLTGKKIDVFIFDDLYKNTLDANSSVYRDKVLKFFNSVASTRGHKKEKMVMLYTRWHEEDLAGVLLEEQKKKWGVITFQGIKTKTVNHPRDPRKEGQILWDARHSLEKYNELKKIDEITFESLIQQDPKPKKGLMYPRHKVWETLDNIRGIRKCYVDTADTGEDYLAAVFYIEVKEYCYITDIYFTKESMDITYIELARKLYENGTNEAYIESNNGGRFYGSQVEKEYRRFNSRCIFFKFHQSKNKEARIYSNSASVMNYIFFPKGWENIFKNAYTSFTSYKITGKNKSDDFQDSLSGVIERNPFINDIFNKLTGKVLRGNKKNNRRG